MNKETSEKCKYCWPGHCFVKYEIEAKQLVNECPCVSCIVKVMCNSICTERRVYSKLILPRMFRNGSSIEVIEVKK